MFENVRKSIFIFGVDTSYVISGGSRYSSKLKFYQKGKSPIMITTKASKSGPPQPVDGSKTVIRCIQKTNFLLCGLDDACFCASLRSPQIRLNFLARYSMWRSHFAGNSDRSRSCPYCNELLSFVHFVSISLICLDELRFINSSQTRIKLVEIELRVWYCPGTAE